VRLVDAWQQEQAGSLCPEPVLDALFQQAVMQLHVLVFESYECSW
jgi:hypothetical protein